MAKKKVDPLKAKAAKQKKMAIGLSVVFVLIIAYQGPKTMKMLQGPPAPAPAAAPIPTPVIDPATGVPAGTVPPVGAPAPATAAGAPASSDQPAVLASTEQPAAGPGQLLSFERFESKDPFAQQVALAGVGSPEGAGGAAVGADPNPPAAGAGETPAGGAGAVPPAAGDGSSPSPPLPSGPGQPATGQPATQATTTTISVNGVSGPAEIGKEFPVADPVLVLVSAASDGKSVKIGIAGGAYADGAQTITLKLGKPLTLQNTADGTRYELELETVAGFVPPAPKK